MTISTETLEKNPLADITPALELPFSYRDIDFLPSPKYLREKDGKKLCQSYPYADKRVYEDRLNEVCPGEWTSSAVVIVAGSKIICISTVVIWGIAHTDVGEAALSSENAATEALAQSFKRACSQFRLGRYLYDFPMLYLPWISTGENKGRYDLTPSEKQGYVKTMYRKFGFQLTLLKAGNSPAPADESEQEQSHEQPAAQVSEPAQTTTQEHPVHPVTSEQMKRLTKLAKEKRYSVKNRPRTFEAAEELIAKIDKLSA